MSIHLIYCRFIISISLAIASLNNAHGNTNIENLTKNPANWATWGGNYAATRYSELSQINTSNVKQLRPAWMFSTGVLCGHEDGPLVVNDIIYIHTPFPNTVYALEQKTQSMLWEYTPKQDAGSTLPVMCCDTGNRGLAYGDGKIFLQQSDTVLTALNAKTGQLVWQVRNGDPKFGMTNTNAPLVVKNKVITGISGGEFGVRGFLAAYDIDTGKLVWKGYSTGSDEEMLINPVTAMTWSNGRMQAVGKNSSLDTWQGKQWKIGGGTTWGWYSFDPKLNLIYYGSGNPSPWNPKQRAGDNKWTNAIWARDADSGEVKWVYQMTPHDEWDYDGVNESVLVEQQLNGAQRNTLVHFDRNGFVYTLDRETGELLAATKYDRSVNWATHIDLHTGRPQIVTKYSPDHNGEDVNTYDICPATLGAKNQQPVSYSPQTGLFYISGNHLCMEYEPFTVSYTAGQPYVGATLNIIPAAADVLTGTKDDSTNLGQFTAFDAKTGKIVWSNKEAFSIWSGSVATAGGQVFYGTLEGYLKAVDAKTGQELYKFKTPSGIIGNVNTWAYQGKQYVGVLSGIGGWVGTEVLEKFSHEYEFCDPRPCGVDPEFSLLRYTQQGGVFTVFSLPD